jgi:sarcosine oxidase
MERHAVTVAVIGLGGMGSAALYHLARRGVHAIGLEQFTPAHAKGASHGRSRIIRQAYFEDPSYVPLLRRAYELWSELNDGAAEPVWKICGGVTIGPRGAPLVEGTLLAARVHDVAHEIFSGRHARRRFPAFRTGDDDIAVYEPTVGALFPEACVREHLHRATACGAAARFETTVRAISERNGRVEIELRGGERVAADRVLICAGPWIGAFAEFPVRVERNVQHWFAPPAHDAPHEIFMVQRSGWQRLFYGFPDMGDGIKAAYHHSGEFVDSPEHHEVSARADEIARARDTLADVLTQAVGNHLRSDPCMYALTPDEHFIIGALPGHDNTFIAGGFSGHGFKFCSVVGEMLAQIAIDGTTRHDTALFAPTRFRGILKF